MTGALKLALVWVVAALLAGGLVACGDDDSSTTETSASAPPSASDRDAGGDDGAKPKQDGSSAGKTGKGDSAGSAAPDSPDSPDSSSDSPDSSSPAPSTPRSSSPSGRAGGEGSAAFRTPGGDNSVQDFGAEANASEREQAAAALQGYLQARVNEEWETACSYMASSITEQLEQLASGSKGKFEGCPGMLEALSASLPADAKASLATAEVGSLRVEGDRAFVLYRGGDGTAFFMPMAREGGEWKVASLAGSAF